MTQKIAKDYLNHFNEVKKIIDNKKSIQKFYEEIFLVISKYIYQDQEVIELGSGYSQIKKYIPNAKTSDFIKLPFHDLQLDAMNLQLSKNVDNFILINTLHHIPDISLFFKEAINSLNKNGKIIIIDQYLSFISRLVFNYFHHEPFDPKAIEWKLNDKNNLNDANGALAWIIFNRDKKIFKNKFPELEITTHNPISGLYYWLSGGLKSWTLIPNFLISPIFKIDQILCKILPKIFGSFQIIILEKKID